jgi:antitoxin component HigA of HigAB toxin-antitoxin module
MHPSHSITESEYRQALDEIMRLVQSEPDRRSPQGARLDALAALADAYEAGRYGDCPNDIEAR